jgi:2-aminoadipate transaminase
MKGSIERHLGGIAHYLEPLGGGHLWVELDSPVSERDLVDEAWRQGVAYAPGGAMSVARTQGLFLRLSYCYLEPDEMDEGIRRLASALETLSARPARRAAAPV